LEAEFIPAAHLDEIRAVDMEVFASGTRQRCEERFTDQEGTTRYFWSVKAPLIHAGKADALIGISTDITELRQLREELERRATTDSLTGLANRGHFYEQANRHVQQAQRYGDALSLLALDIDHFKSINDTHGHQAGDSVLRGLAEHFRQGIRVFDLIGRVGGEEFAILLPNTDLDGAVGLAERLRESLTALRFKVDGETECVVTVSIGAASLLPADAGLDRLFARADQALYRAKAAGRNRVETIEERVPGKRASLRPVSALDADEPGGAGGDTIRR
jgi:diguanylate cyclase (GGDEF)-like protein